MMQPRFVNKKGEEVIVTAPPGTLLSARIVDVEVLANGSISDIYRYVLEVEDQYCGRPRCRTCRAELLEGESNQCNKCKQAR